jgi:hypothetical protein
MYKKNRLKLKLLVTFTIHHIHTSSENYCIKQEKKILV